MTAAKDTFEIVFSFDTTGSMFAYLEEVRRRLRDMMRELLRKIPGLKIAIFAHGDYDTWRTYVTKHINFTSDVEQLCQFVQTAAKTGGHGPPECYEKVLHEVARDLSWTAGSHRSLVLVGDAHCHEPYDGEEKHGIDWRKETKELRDMDVKIYAVQVEDYASSRNFYNHISSQTFGDHMSLSNINDVQKVLMKICFREAGLEGSSSGMSKPSTFSTAASLIEPTKKHIEEIGDTLEDDEEQSGLICEVCKVGKLSNEFPPTTLTEDCEHATGICLRCVVRLVKENNVCPHEGCGKPVNIDSMEMQWFQAILDEMFLDYSKVIAANRMGPDGDGGNHITVATLNGDAMWIPFNPKMTVEKLKVQIQEEFKLEPKQQKLLFQEQGMKTKKGTGLYTLDDYKVSANSTIYLLVPLYCVPEDLDHVVFDLSWGFPDDGVDFLDATCFAFQNNEFVQVIDWTHPTNKYYLHDSIKHSEKNEQYGRSGHQSINVRLKRVPKNITHLYFTLSSWKSSNLSAFSNPSLKFYDASDPSIDLCETTFGHALSSQAVIMCSVVRSDKLWNIFECEPPGALVDGNSKKYNPIRQRISELIDDMD